MKNFVQPRSNKLLLVFACLKSSDDMLLTDKCLKMQEKKLPRKHDDLRQGVYVLIKSSLLLYFG